MHCLKATDVEAFLTPVTTWCNNGQGRDISKLAGREWGRTFIKLQVMDKTKTAG